MGKLKNGIRALEKTAPDMDAFIGKEYLDAGGTAVVHIGLKSITDIISPYSLAPQLSLSPDFVSYVDHKVYPIPLKYPIKLNFVGPLSQEEKAKVRDLIKDYYSLVLTDRRADLRFLFYKVLGLVALGVAGLALFFAVESGDGNMFSETISIIGSFALWEAADSIILERKELKQLYLAAGQVATAQIDFVEAEQKGN